MVSALGFTGITCQPCSRSCSGTAYAAFSGWRDAPTTAMVVDSSRIRLGPRTGLTIARRRLEEGELLRGSGRRPGSVRSTACVPVRSAIAVLVDLSMLGRGSGADPVSPRRGLDPGPDHALVGLRRVRPAAVQRSVAVR